MDVIDQEALQISGVAYAGQLDGAGGIRPIGEADIAHCDHPCWLHLDIDHQASMEWLNNTPLIPDPLREPLAGNSARPRINRLPEGALIILRSINFHTEEFPEELIVLRIYITDKLIVTTRRQPIQAVEEILGGLRKKQGPVNSGTWLVEMSDTLTDHTSDFIDEMHDRIIALENDLLEQRIPPRGQLAQLRKQLIVLRRYMGPQRDVFSRLASEHLAWMDKDDRRRMQDIADRLGRGIEDIDGGIARTAVIADEITSLTAEAINRRSYTMSLMAMVFLPTTFLTGLFGVNLGGIPGGNMRYGFSLFCLLLILLVLGVAWWLKHRKWL
ncbi:zinc transporter ZntB [Sodalis sp. dw_96]|uniref:zinc transporter ZntB n=1 Tax=Sodalis sp. dw_96 TaxID=2719794 RepID=UPI001BD3ABF0|nr:zinc transporter ZntB [Sodalis sp. dw_96]